MGLFNGKATQTVRDAKQANREAHNELHAHQDDLERRGVVYDKAEDDPKYMRLNKKANQTHAAVRAAKKNARRR